MKKRYLSNLITGLFVLCSIFSSGVAVGDLPIPDLIAHWSFDEMSGNVARDSVGIADGFLDGFGDPGSAWTDGVVGGALEFNGINESVRIGGIPAVPLTEEITISAWVRLDNLSGYKTIYASDEWMMPGAVKLELFNEMLSFEVNGGGYLAGTLAIGSAGQWHHIAVAYSNFMGQAILYVNDMEVRMEFISSTQPIELMMPASIGAWNNPGQNYFDGAMDDVRIYSRMLPEHEIRMLSDQDLDGVLDNVDNCPLISNFGQEDSDSDGIGDVCDDDDDGDGVLDVDDNCVLTPNPGQEDIDEDGVGDACDDDIDGDGVLNIDDNCVFTPNGGQEDADGDGVGDVCDDSDGDGVFDDVDNCLDTPNGDQADMDNDGTGDACDDDIDGDGVLNIDDNCVLTPNGGQEDYDEDGTGDACDDSDGDGVFDDVDNCPETPNADQTDIDDDGTGDLCDDDIDGDGVLNIDDNCVLTPNVAQEDADGDGAGDVCDGILYVDDDGPSPYSTIQSAIDAAVNGDTVIVMEGTYIENINMSGKAITLRSTDPTNPVVVTSTIIDGGASGSVITCSSGEDPNTVIEGFVITNGSADIGGGMYNEYSSSPTVNNCMFSSNTASLGGGMYNYYSSPMVNNCTFSGNTVANGNSGGGMFNDYSSPTVSNCMFSGNTASAGGGMFNLFSPLTVSNCTFSSNTANEGGGMYNDSCSPTVSNCTFSGNMANYWGGGMYNYFSSPVLSNCIMWGDTAASDNEIYIQISNLNFMFCDIQGSGGSSGWDGSLGTDGGGNIDTDPLFVNPADGDYFLKSEAGNFTINHSPFGPAAYEVFSLVTSPCIDAGNPASDVGEEPEGNGDRINMGAFGGTRQASRSSYVPPVEGDVDGDGDVDIYDFVLMADNWLAGT